MNPFEIHKYPRTSHCIMCQVLDYYFEHFKMTMKYSLIFVYSTCPRWFSATVMSGVLPVVNMIAMGLPKASTAA